MAMTVPVSDRSHLRLAALCSQVSPQATTSPARPVLIVGAGIAGVAVAYFLAREGVPVLLVDPGAPLMEASSSSGGNFRTSWPHEMMRRLAERSLELLAEISQEHGDFCRLQPRGYAYLSRNRARPAHDELTTRTKFLGEDLGAQPDPTGGSLEAFKLGTFLLESALAQGAKHLRGRVLEVMPGQDLVQIMVEEVSSGAMPGQQRLLEGRAVVNAAGAHFGKFAEQLGAEYPVSSQMQQKVSIPDPAGVVPQDAPFCIYQDSPQVEWTEEDRKQLCSYGPYESGPVPGNVHLKPSRPGWIKMGWAINRYDADIDNWSLDPNFPKLLQKAAASILPALGPLFESEDCHLHGHLYTTTPENLPILGPTAIARAGSGSQRLFDCGALGGFGIMMALAAGEIVASWVQGREGPAAFRGDRYQDPGYLPKALTIASGQL